MLNKEIRRKHGPVLVVEDVPSMMIALRDILISAGYIVRTAANGQAALDVMAEVKPSLILSDISMPVMDGIQLFGAVRKHGPGRRLHAEPQLCRLPHRNLHRHP